MYMFGQISEAKVIFGCPAYTPLEEPFLQAGLSDDDHVTDSSEAELEEEHQTISSPPSPVPNPVDSPISASRSKNSKGIRSHVPSED
jgi:hypothetical protein